VAHACPHAPQLLESVCVSVHVPLQIVAHDASVMLASVVFESGVFVSGVFVSAALVSIVFVSGVFVSAALASIVFVSGVLVSVAGASVATSIGLGASIVTRSGAWPSGIVVSRPASMEFVAWVPHPRARQAKSERTDQRERFISLQANR